MKRLIQSMTLICLLLLAIHLLGTITYSWQGQEEQTHKMVAGYTVVELKYASYDHYLITQDGDIYKWNNLSKGPAKLVCNVWAGEK